jgi:hypothetical protein
VTGRCYARSSRSGEVGRRAVRRPRAEQTEKLGASEQGRRAAPQQIRWELGGSGSNEPS